MGASTLFAEDPLVFKSLIYEMRFDEASAKFAEFGPLLHGDCNLPPPAWAGNLKRDAAAAFVKRPYLAQATEAALWRTLFYSVTIEVSVRYIGVIRQTPCAVHFAFTDR